MKRIYVSLVLIIVAGMRALSAAPDTLRSYSFIYDESGNRILREAQIVQLKSGSSVSADYEHYQESVLVKELSDRTIKIYPNPTKGSIKISISESLNDSPRVIVYNTSGQVLVDMHIEGTESEINLSRQCPGIYLLRIIINGRSSEWKVLKE
jgi:hypothetical protein